MEKEEWRLINGILRKRFKIIGMRGKWKRNEFKLSENIRNMILKRMLDVIDIWLGNLKYKLNWWIEKVRKLYRLNRKEKFNRYGGKEEGGWEYGRRKRRLRKMMNWKESSGIKNGGRVW